MQGLHNSMIIQDPIFPVYKSIECIYGIGVSVGVSVAVGVADAGTGALVVVDVAVVDALPLTTITT